MTRYTLDTTGDGERDNPKAFMREDPEGAWVLRKDDAMSEPLTAEERTTLARIADDMPVWMGDDDIASFPHPGSAAGRDVLTVFELLPRLLATLDAARPSGEVERPRPARRADPMTCGNHLWAIGAPHVCCHPAALVQPGLDVTIDYPTVATGGVRSDAAHDRPGLDVERLRIALDMVLPGSLTFVTDLAADVAEQYAALDGRREEG